MKGFKPQNDYSGCSMFPKKYYPSYLKDISNNRFLCISNYGIKLYSLNQIQGYSSYIFCVRSKTINLIKQINERDFIFCANESYGASLGGPEFTRLAVDKNSKEIFEYYGYYYTNIYSCIILKTKYLLLLFSYSSHNEDLAIFDISNGKLLKKYCLNCKEIIEWNSIEDNEFLVLVDKNVILVELNDNDLSLKFKAYATIESDYLEGKLRKVNETENKFYRNCCDNTIEVY